jgi:ribonucleoside-triphosphate reductase
MLTEKYNKYKPLDDYIQIYSKASNAATGSKFDSNANVDNKNVCTLSNELNKGDLIGVNRYRMIQKLTELFGQEWAEEYIRQLEAHEIYRHDETHPVMPYCVSITLYPFILDGMRSLGAPSGAPNNLSSFCGNFINLVFAVASQFAGAVATPEYLAYLDYFIRKEYGDDYYLRADEVVDLSMRKRTIRKVITDCFEQVAYSLNEPAAARGYQAVFWNISYYDKTYFNAIFEDFVFPDGGEMQWESVSWLQKLHMEWLNTERLREWLTFPVETVNLVYDKETKVYYDEDWATFSAKMWAKGHSFFCYNSDSADSLSSCCRLKNGITDNVFSYTLGAGGISTGSKAVVTINVNRLVQDAVANGEDIADKMRQQAEKNIKYLLAFNALLEEELAAGLLPVYNAGYISLEKQYLTTGINGFVEAAEYMGLDISDNEDYYAFGRTILEPIMEVNKSHRTDKVMFNTEYVPAENVGVKHSNWDRESGYVVPRNCYNSYFFKVEDDTLSILDKMAMHGDRMVRYLDGGSAAHLNLSEHLTEAQYRKLLDVAAQEGCSYFTFNVPNTICNECGHISKHYMHTCHKCGSDNVDWLTRIIGYVKRISAWSEARQKEGAQRHYHEEC